MSAETALSAASMALLNKLAPHPREDATELIVRAARNRRLALADDLRGVEAAARAALPASAESRLRAALLRIFDMAEARPDIRAVATAALSGDDQ